MKLRFLLIGFLMCISIPAFSANITWNGSAGDHVWSTAGNWVGGVAPASGDNVYFQAPGANPTLLCNVTASATCAAIYIITAGTGVATGTAQTITLNINSGVTLTTTNFYMQPSGNYPCLLYTSDAADE